MITAKEAYEKTKKSLSKDLDCEMLNVLEAVNCAIEDCKYNIICKIYYEETLDELMKLKYQIRKVPFLGLYIISWDNPQEDVECLK